MADIVDKEMLHHLAKLSKIALSDEETERLQKHLHSIIAHFHHLQTINTDGIPPCNQVTNLCNVVREDQVSKTFPRDRFLKNTPSHIGGMVHVPSFIQF